MRQDGCTCDAMEMAHLPGCEAMPMRDKAEIEAALRERINDHVTAVAKWALREYRADLREKVMALTLWTDGATVTRAAVLALLDEPRSAADAADLAEWNARPRADGGRP